MRKECICEKEGEKVMVWARMQCISEKDGGCLMDSCDEDDVRKIKGVW